MSKPKKINQSTFLQRQFFFTVKFYNAKDTTNN